MTLSFFEELDFDGEPETQPQEQPRRGRGFRRGGGGDGGRSGGRRSGPEFQRLAVLGVLVLAVLFVGWYVITSCQDDAQKRAYRKYVENVNSVAEQSKQVGQQLDNALNNADMTSSGLISLVGQLASRHRGIEQNAAQLHDTGALKGQNTWLVTAMQYRTRGLDALRSALEKVLVPGKKVTADGAATVAREYSLLHTSDDLYRYSFEAPSQATLTQKGITDATIADSQFVPDASIVDIVPANMQSILEQLQATGTSTKGGQTTCPPNALIGTGLVSVVANPGNIQLTPGTSKSTPTNVKSSLGLHFTVTVKNTGNLRVTNVQVRFWERDRPTPVQAQSATIRQILPGNTATVDFKPTTPVPFGGPELIQVNVVGVHCEKLLSNNKASYPVLFLA